MPPTRGRRVSDVGNDAGAQVRRLNGHASDARHGIQAVRHSFSPTHAPAPTHGVTQTQLGHGRANLKDHTLSHPAQRLATASGQTPEQRLAELRAGLRPTTAPHPAQRPPAHEPTLAQQLAEAKAELRPTATPQRPPYRGNAHAGWSGPPMLTGTSGGQTHYFRPGDVHSIPMVGASGQVFGMSFPSKDADPAGVVKWASQPNRTSDTTYISGQTVPKSGGGKGFQQQWQVDAPWDRPPVYSHAHANPNAFGVRVDGGTSSHVLDGQRLDYTKLSVDGAAHGQALAANGYYQALSGGDPHRPLVYMSCNSGNPVGNAAASSAAALGHGGPVYAPTGTGWRMPRPDSGTSMYGVSASQQNDGRWLPGQFTQVWPPRRPAP
ncbi:hypothetical protein F0L68_08330 [Solihabitans fulvus]|uniref:Uncharacterized protein n=1 Tax=Solihabitans fulvus TaxID=1892852 RepID=A0A5B2XMP9_9PSEU|nr:hypothetical protein [Solihabitans fulvus]KAA2264234.1 hypothetical protein F0L68_08330 [Solihabitans fulvus]